MKNESDSLPEITMWPVLTTNKSVLDNLPIFRSFKLSVTTKGKLKFYTCIDNSLSHKMKTVRLFVYASLVLISNEHMGIMTMKSTHQNNFSELTKKTLSKGLQLDEVCLLYLNQADISVGSKVSIDELKKILKNNLNITDERAA